IQGGFHVGYRLDYTTRGAWRRGARCRRSGAWRQRRACASRRTQDLRSHSRRLLWRLVLAEGRRHFGETRPQGLRAVADWPRRPLASFEHEPDARHAHHRYLQLFKWEEIKNACLVPHSYGGWPASGALEQIGDRVTSIVWLDAFMPKDGERSTDMISEFSRRALVEAMAKGEPGRKPAKASQYSISEKDYAWMDSKLTAQPNSITDNPIKLTGALQKVPKKTFIRAPKYPQAAFDRAYAECKADPSWTTYVAENSHHDVMIDQPEWLADILMKHS